MNLLLITSEDNGPHLGCYGDTTTPTPHLDALAADGTRFDNAYVTQAVCSPSRASILTGLYPHQNGQIGLASHAFGMWDDIATLPAILKAAGYRTGRIGKLHVNPESASPFDMVWNDPACISFANRDVHRTAEVAGDFMGNGDAPFFLMVNYADAHVPWLRQECGLPEHPLNAGDVQVPPGVGLSSQRLRQHTADYYNCLSRLDTGIGLLLAQLERRGLAEETLVIYLADHGPQFSRGKGSIYELATRVPLLVRWPGLPGERASDALVSCVDVMPTALDALELPVPEGLAGRSLRPLLSGESSDWRESVCTEWTTSHPWPEPSFLFPQRAIRDARYKLIQTLLPGHTSPVERYYTQHVLLDNGVTQWEIDHADAATQAVFATWRQPPPLELYDLQQDPRERHNLADDPQHAAIRERLLKELTAWREETADPLLDPAKLGQLVAEHAAINAAPGSHRQPGFRWRYLDYFRA